MSIVRGTKPVGDFPPHFARISYIYIQEGQQRFVEGLASMARKKRARAAAIEPERVPVRVLVDAVDESAVYYANYVECSFAPHECLLSFARVPAKLSVARTEEAKGGTLRLEPLVQIIVPPTLMPGLIRALTTTKEGYEKIMGPIKEPDAPI
jgi:hypothetical protein